MDVRVGLQRKLSTEELMLWSVVLEKTLESPLDCKEIHPVHPKGDQSWVFIGRTDAEAETPILWPPVGRRWLLFKRPWCWEGLKAGGEGDDRGWDGWMASLTQWTWVWVDSPGVGDGRGALACCSQWSHRVGHDWVTGLNWRLPPTWRMMTMFWPQPHRPQTCWNRKLTISPSYLTINISEVITYPANFTFKNSSRKTIREFRHFEQKTPNLFVWLLQRTFSALNSIVWFVGLAVCQAQ